MCLNEQKGSLVFSKMQVKLIQSLKRISVFGLGIGMEFFSQYCKYNIPDSIVYIKNKF